MSEQVFTVSELETMARNVAKGGLIPGITTMEAAFTLMLVGQSKGLHPVQALQQYHIVKGRLSMRSDAMQAEFQRLGGIIKWGTVNDTTATATFSHPIHMPDGVTITWDMKRATQAGVTGSQTWKNYPAQMLAARVVSEGVRRVMPGVLTGIYTPEEVESFDERPQRGHAIDFNGTADGSSATVQRPLPPAEPSSGEGPRLGEITEEGANRWGEMLGKLLGRWAKDVPLPQGEAEAETEQGLRTESLYEGVAAEAQSLAAERAKCGMDAEFVLRLACGNWAWTREAAFGVLKTRLAKSKVEAAA